MVCYAPMVAYRSREVGASGKRGITFRRDASLSGERMQLPCGKCVGCKLERSRQWAMRLMHEKKLWSDTCFVTLTYDNAHLPPGGTLVKRDVQLFMKRLRKAREPNKIRFYACGEYGEQNGRPHYHLILFNVAFSDRVVWRGRGRKTPLYTSKELSSVWDSGNALLGDVSFDSCAYVARYVVSKIDGEKAKAHYEVCDGDGVVYSRLPEFSLMSRGEGIGKGWYRKFGAHAVALRSVISNGKECRLPRFYESLCEAECSDVYESYVSDMKKQRVKFIERSCDRRRVKEIIAIRRLRELRRTI